MDDDFNTPLAISVLRNLSGELNKARKKKDPHRIGQLAGSLTYLGEFLGILQGNPDLYLQDKHPYSLRGDPSTQANYSFNLNELVEQNIQARFEAKKTKNWALADKIRDELKTKGVILEDAPDGTTSWRRE
jgi:cysteinyl-tRNA synthetase